VFPYDYPETKAGDNWLKQMTFLPAIRNYALRPPSKRVNFQRLKNKYPFGRLDIREKYAAAAKDLLFVSITALSQGVPKPNA